MKNTIKLSIMTGLVVLLNAACVKDLDRAPFVEVTSASVFKDPANYKNLLAKIYAGFSISGQQGPAGKPDITGIDEGFSTYLRQYWKAQELTTDEAVVGWNDGSIKDYHNMVWGESNEFVAAMYNRIFYQIVLCNEFIRETTEAKLSERGITIPEVKAYRAEVRFLRALSYYHAMDMFANPPFVTDADAVGSSLPKQTNRKDLFAYIESECKAIEGDMKASRTNGYGRADQACVNMLLAKIYLNAKVYIGTDKNNECVDACKKVIGGGFVLDKEYRTLFMLENETSKEVIFPICFDGIRTQTYGGMTFLLHAPVGGSMKAAEFGINGGWAGLRTTKAFVNLFADPTGATDKRAMFYTDGQNLEIADIGKFTDGYAIAKFRNVDLKGKAGSDPKGDFPDTDFPMFRLADAYLMYAEAVVRGATTGDRATALSYCNALRERAYSNKTGNITDGAMNLDYILAERGRELQWECHRRTDLIRFGKFTTGDYLWPWKGGAKTGAAVSDDYNIFPIPAADRVANPNLVQNKGY
jgi:starch-binding outer membrane protein, SusD/RagB family